MHLSITTSENRIFTKMKTQRFHTCSGMTTMLKSNSKLGIKKTHVKQKQYKLGGP